METRRLEFLLELSRLGSMRAVADHLGTTTSTVSQQLAVLARETGAGLIEADGRNVRLTAAGRRLAGHAVAILGAVSAARADLSPSAEPAGTVRVSGFATAIRRAIMPVIGELARSYPAVRLVVREHEPAEARALLATDDIDLALNYDYDLAPATPDDAIVSVPLWSQPWALGVPAPDAAGVTGPAAQVFGAFRDRRWIGNSRNQADERVIRLIASMAGFEPEFAHEADSLDLVEDLILAGLGIGMLPADRTTKPGVSMLALGDPGVNLRAFAETGRGRTAWPPLALVLQLIRAVGPEDPAT